MKIVARIGGEEFAWLLPESDAIGAMRAGERARRIVESSPFDSVGAMTISAGVCALGDLNAPEELLGCADRALYWAKSQGRNVVTAYSTDSRGAPAEIASDELSSRLRARASIMALARTVDAKDRSTLLHSQRVADLAGRLAQQRGWTAPRATLLREAGLLHDVGKIGVPDSVLRKQGRLSDEEYELVRSHASLGAEIAGEVLNDDQVSWIRGHHERWDGRGYPDQLSGDEIPDGASLLALADAWDTMTNERPYQPSTDRQDAIKECQGEAGRQFCPNAVAALLQLAADDRLDAPEPGHWLETDQGAA